jgi:hypothetical protein
VGPRAAPDSLGNHGTVLSCDANLVLYCIVHVEPRPAGMRFFISFKPFFFSKKFKKVHQRHHGWRLARDVVSIVLYVCHDQAFWDLPLSSFAFFASFSKANIRGEFLLDLAKPYGFCSTWVNIMVSFPLCAHVHSTYVHAYVYSCTVTVSTVCDLTWFDFILC